MYRKLGRNSVQHRDLQLLAPHEVRHERGGKGESTPPSLLPRARHSLSLALEHAMDNVWSEILGWWLVVMVDGW